VVVFARLVCRAIGHSGLRIGLGNREAVLKAVRGTRCPLLLPNDGRLGIAAARRNRLRAGVVDDRGWRRRAAVAGVADQQILALAGAVDIVCKDAGTSVVPTIGIGIGDLNASIQV